ncbi:5032_t:CDS:2 [Ambispora leptoticha]|uniref:5032_t:CDS:1 n=1 Tax=Ambispora leptoticha TaxID=144679 RepID=A0A9N9AID1_9GLOM|nr:5032_t:CDS:2 [Ambispora leptoticha]
MIHIKRRLERFLKTNYDNNSSSILFNKNGDSVIVQQHTWTGTDVTYVYAEAKKELVASSRPTPQHKHQNIGKSLWHPPLPSSRRELTLSVKLTQKCDKKVRSGVGHWVAPRSSNCDINTDQYQSSSSTSSLLTPGGNSSSSIISSSLRPRFSDFRPRDAFKKFCRDVITATQVSHSVILLSLLYISRMKSNNPAIQEDQYFDWLQVMDQFVLESEISQMNSNRDRLTQADCAIAINNNMSAGGVIPMEITSTPSNSFKRSAEEAFVDTGVVTSPPKRVPIYPSAPISTSSSSQSQQQTTNPTIRIMQQYIATRPTNPPSVTYYQLPSFANSSNTMNFLNSSSNHNQLHQHPHHKYYARKLHLQSNFLNARSPAGFAQINSMQFPTTVV